MQYLSHFVSNNNCCTTCELDVVSLRYNKLSLWKLLGWWETSDNYLNYAEHNIPFSIQYGPQMLLQSFFGMLFNVSYMTSLKLRGKWCWVKRFALAGFGKPRKNHHLLLRKRISESLSFLNRNTQPPFLIYFWNFLFLRFRYIYDSIRHAIYMLGFRVTRKRKSHSDLQNPWALGIRLPKS